MTPKYIDNVLISSGCILILASFWFFSTGKKKGSDFKNIVAQITFVKKSVKTKMTGSVAWYTGEEEEKINAYGLGFTGKESSARYLYLNKFQIISLDDSLVEFLPKDELQVSKGKFMVLNPDGALKISDKNGNSQIVKPGMLYETTQNGLVETPTTWKKSWIAEGEPYSLILKDNVLTEYFLLSPPTIIVDRFGATCIGRLKPIESDTGDVRYQIRADGQDLILTNMQVNLPTKKSLIELRSVADSVNSVWREVAVPSHCITKPEPIIVPEPIPEPLPVPVPVPVPEPPFNPFKIKDTIIIEQ